MFGEHGTPFSPLARFHFLQKNLGNSFGFLGFLKSPPHSRALRARPILDCILPGSHYTTKSELISPKIQTRNSKNGLGRAKQYFLGYGFALPRLYFRAGGSGRNAREIRDGTYCIIKQ